MVNIFTDTKINQKAFTLVEMMVVVAIISILSAIGFGFTRSYLPVMRLRSNTMDVYSALMQAKVEAIRQGNSVTVMFTPAGDSYTVFQDANGNNAVDAGETVLQVTTPFSEGVTFDNTLAADADGVSFANNAAVFTSRGLPAGLGTVALCSLDSQGNIRTQREITVSITGNIDINIP